MKKYFYLQFKRVLKFFPFFLAVTLILMVGLAAILSGIIQNFNNGEDNQRFKIAITGDIDNDYLKWGMTAMQTFDETRFAIEFIEMTETDAEKALADGRISAYVVLPDNFMENVLIGRMDPIKYVTTPGMGGVVSMFKNEVTGLVTDMVVYSQKGTYGIYDAMRDNGLSATAGDCMNRISIEYVDLILHRSKIYNLEELGISNGLSTAEYFVCGITVLMLMLIGLPYVTVYVKKDYSLNSLLLARGYSNLGQMLCEYISHLVSLLLLVTFLAAGAGVVVNLIFDTLADFVTSKILSAYALRIIPILVMLSAFNIMIFELSNNIVSSVLLHFFISISVCYISGCLYPTYAFPKTVQLMAVFLPTSVAKGYLAGSFNGNHTVWEFVGILAYTVLFFGIALAVRIRKTARKRG